MFPSLGETLQQARLARGVTLEDAERVTRIPRRYLEALEQENYGILPAPVYARGFLRSYAGYLGLDSGQLMPFFPVGHVEEPKLEPLPKVRQRRTWSMSGLTAVAAVAALILAVVALYSFGQDSGESALVGSGSPAITSEQSPQGEGVMVELEGRNVEDAVAILEERGADYVLIAIQTDGEKGQVVDQNPEPGEPLESGEAVTLILSR